MLICSFIDANPETIIIGTANPKTTKQGDEVADITGIVTYAFGFYRILPTTAIKITKAETATAKPTKLDSKGKCSGLTFGAYNVENLSPNSTHLPAIAAHIVEYLRSPDFLFLQEVQDDNGAVNDAGTSKFSL